MMCLTGCGSLSVESYKFQKPALNLAEFFTGNTKAYGILQDRSGKVTRRFTADIVGTFNGDDGVLEEVFEFDNGEIQKRTWNLTQFENGTVEATAGDVVGTALGQISGNAFNLKYTLAIDRNGSTWNIKMDDWMHLIDENTIMNRTVMTKFGFKVGELSIIIQKQ